MLDDMNVEERINHLESRVTALEDGSPSTGATVEMGVVSFSGHARFGDSEWEYEWGCLVEDGIVSSSGTGYHHLQALTAAGWIEKNKGSFCIKSVRAIPLLTVITATEDH